MAAAALLLPPRSFSSAILSALMQMDGAGCREGLVSAPHPFPTGLQVDGVSYLLQEIYGIENKYNTQDCKVYVPASHIPWAFP